MFAQKKKKDHDSMDHRWGIVGSEIIWCFLTQNWSLNSDGLSRFVDDIPQIVHFLNHGLIHVRHFWCHIPMLIV